VSTYRWAGRLAVLATTLLMAGPLVAQGGLIRIVYTFGAGGSGDVTGRLIAEHMQRSLGTPVILENKVGASGRIAADTVKLAPPDGNTLLLAFMGTMVILPHTVDNIRFDPFKDFVPVAHVADSPLALTVASATQARDVKEYVAQVKSGRTTNFFGVAPLGGLPHFLGLQFAAANGIEMTAVGYKGGAQMAQAVVAGEVPATYSTPADLVALHKAGKARILAVSASQRMPLLPDVPTFKEAGYDVQASTWLALFAPKGTPAAAVNRVSAAVAEALKDPAIARRVNELGMEPTGHGPGVLGEAMRRDFDRWGPVIKSSGYRVTE
jgi:tripartite-type tricarboxylate transporter receptor subunit TctC